ncbi:DNA-binding anti-repressor SinI [Lentibacillus sediminis]|nr:DNA-binding anti-repressor SinI [Lentibacillus sediminis]
MEKTIKDAAIDYEWAVLIAEAKIIGMTTEEVRQFLQVEAEAEKSG